MMQLRIAIVGMGALFTFEATKQIKSDLQSYFSAVKKQTVFWPSKKVAGSPYRIYDDLYMFIAQDSEIRENKSEIVVADFSIFEAERYALLAFDNDLSIMDAHAMILIEENARDYMDYYDIIIVLDKDYYDLRYAGKEMINVFPMTSSSNADVVAEQIRSVIETRLELENG